VNTEPEPPRSMSLAALLLSLFCCVSSTAGSSTHEQAADISQIQERAEVMYQAAAEDRWIDAYSLFDPQEAKECDLDHFVYLFRRYRPFKVLKIQVRALEDDELPREVVRSWERVVGTSLKLRVEYPDGSRRTLRRCTDTWVKVGRQWYFASHSYRDYGGCEA
jgi:hypothetical protein